jgi:hypothetical protein
MQRLRKIFYEAFVSTGRFPRRWILALVQAAALYSVGELLQPRLLLRPFSVCWLILAVAVMAPVTAWLWLDIAAYASRIKNRVKAKVFLTGSLAMCAIVLCSAAVMAVAKFIYPDWLFSALLSSIISATSTLALLYIILCGQTFAKSLTLAFDTWNKKISLAALIAFVLLLTHGVSYALVHGVLQSLKVTRGFSIPIHSATIWVLLLVLFLITAFAAAFLNSFLVLLFLDIIARKKDPESEKAILRRLVTSEANQLYKGG